VLWRAAEAEQKLQAAEDELRKLKAAKKAK
jgi:hypothetical protein